MFSKRLRELRTEKQVSQSDLAKALGISNRTISMYEQKNSEPNIETLVKIANYFGVTTDYLVGLTDVKGSDIDSAYMSSFLGLSENAVFHLPYWHRAAQEGESWQKKTLETINLLFEPSCNLLDNITAYLNFFASHYYNVYDQGPSRHIPISELGFYDERSNLEYSQDWDMWTNALLVQIIEELSRIRKENQKENFNAKAEDGEKRYHIAACISEEGVKTKKIVKECLAAIKEHEKNEN